jgi:hypothetical protein
MFAQVNWPLFNWVTFLILSSSSSLYIFDIKLLTWYKICKYFLPLCRFSFMFWIVSFAMQNLFLFDAIPFIYLYFSWSQHCFQREIIVQNNVMKLPPYSFFSTFTFSILVFISLMHFKLTFTCGQVYGFNFMQIASFLITFIEFLSFPHCFFLISLSKINWP